MNSPGLHTSASLQHTLSPRLQRAVQLLQLSSQDFAQVVRDALDSNPFLEQDEAAGPAGAEFPESGDDTPSHAQAWGMEGPGRLRRAEGDGGVFDTLEARGSLASHLLGQLNVLALPERDFALAASVVESLEDDGYLRTSLEELAQALPLLPVPNRRRC